LSAARAASDLPAVQTHNSPGGHSTTIPLIAACRDWAKHRRRKAVAKCHPRLNLQSFLPRFAVAGTAKHANARRAREVCAGIKAGEIVIFDKAYVDFEHLADLALREVFWVTRTKNNHPFTVVKEYQNGPVGKILADELVKPANASSEEAYPGLMHRVRALGSCASMGQPIVTSDTGVPRASFSARNELILWDSIGRSVKTAILKM
jgi:hypothetical protein